MAGFWNSCESSKRCCSKPKKCSRSCRCLFQRTPSWISLSSCSRSVPPQHRLHATTLTRSGSARPGRTCGPPCGTTRPCSGLRTALMALTLWAPGPFCMCLAPSMRRTHAPCPSLCTPTRTHVSRAIHAAPAPCPGCTSPSVHVPHLCPRPSLACHDIASEVNGQCLVHLRILALEGQSVGQFLEVSSMFLTWVLIGGCLPKPVSSAFP